MAEVTNIWALISVERDAGSAEVQRLGDAVIRLDNAHRDLDDVGIVRICKVFDGARDGPDGRLEAGMCMDAAFAFTQSSDRPIDDFGLDLGFVTLNIDDGHQVAQIKQAGRFGESACAIGVLRAGHHRLVAMRFDC